MHISTSSILTGDDVSVTIGSNSSSDISYMISSDFSEQYIGAQSNQFFAIEIDVENLGYIGISGSNIYDNASAIAFQYWNGSAWVTEVSYQPEWNATVMHVVLNEAEKYRIYITKILSNIAIVVPLVSAGNVWEVSNNGEQAGYSRAWSTPQLTQRTQDNLGMPTSQVIQTTKISGGLTLSNLSTDDTHNVWSPFQYYALKSGFFLVESTDEEDHAYYCYNVKPQAVKAHSQTRSLQIASIKFDCWTGRT